MVCADSVDVWFLRLSLHLSIGDVLVALGTLALAGFTFALARQARNEAEATRESVQLAWQMIEAMDMPYVIPSGYGTSDRITIQQGSTSVLEVRIGLWNLGKGPAMVTDVRLRGLDGDEVVDLVPPPDGEIPVGPSGRADTELELDFNSPLLSAEPVEGLTLTIFYRHAMGMEYVTDSQVRIDQSDLICTGFRRSLIEFDRSRQIPSSGADDL